MQKVTNLTWLVLGGFILATAWMAAGLLCYLSVVGLPLGRQCFRIGRYIYWPFGCRLEFSGIGSMKLPGHVAWLFLLGQVLALLAVLLGAVFCVTVAGLPFGLQYFRLAKAALFPMDTNPIWTDSSVQQSC